MNEFLKYTSPSWSEVLTEQESRIKLSCSGNPRDKYNTQKLSWETNEQFEKRMFYYEFGNNRKIIKAYERILKYGHPKKCPIVNKINNLILFL